MAASAAVRTNDRISTRLSLRGYNNNQSGYDTKAQQIRDCHGNKAQRNRAPSLLSSPSILRVLAFVPLVTLLPFTSAQQSCISLAGSSTCPAFSAASISTGVENLFSFLSNVTDVQGFDTQLTAFVSNAYAQQKYQSNDFFGCSDVDLSNTTDLYARYTYSFICNAIIQNSVSTCQLTPHQALPLCADSCSDFALSEETIISSPQLCGSTGSNAVSQLRADFANCAQPQNALNDTCIPGYQNEPQNCGFQANLVGLCTFCNTSSINNTPSCCVISQAEQRCSNVHLPTYTSMQPLFPTTSSSISSTSPTASGGASAPSSKGLSGGQIAGIVIGAVVGAGLLLALLICCCLLVRRRRSQVSAGSSLNQPTPPISRGRGARGTSNGATDGARVTRMAALEHDSNTSLQGGTDGQVTRARDAPTGAIAGVIGKRGKSDTSGVEDSSPESQGYSSGDGGATGQSEQLDSFKDYYSNDEIRPGDTVSTLWAYAPRANDEFELERGDMLRVVGIWDDGWATGVHINLRADQWEPEHNTQRDSGVSGGTAQEPPPQNGDVKAFPLVCVCLPQHWKKTIEGDATEPDFSSDGGPLSD